MHFLLKINSNITEYYNVPVKILGSGQGFLHEQVYVTFNNRIVLWILMQYTIELMYTFGIIAFIFICIFSSTK